MGISTSRSLGCGRRTLVERTGAILPPRIAELSHLLSARYFAMAPGNETLNGSNLPLGSSPRELSCASLTPCDRDLSQGISQRSEERRVGKECQSRGRL